MQKQKGKIWILTLISLVLILIIGAQIWGNDNIILQCNAYINSVIQDLRNENIPYFRSYIDNYLQFVPALILLGLKFSGIKGNMDNRRFALFIFLAVSITQITVYAIKVASNEPRPDATDYLSFPSGHTATAFMIATMLYLEYDLRSHWLSIFGYLCASIVGAMRILNNRHWIIDVVIGAILGIILTYISYKLCIRILDNNKTDNDN